MFGSEAKKVPESDIVMTSRVRMARNINEYPFPVRMDFDQSIFIINRIKEIIFSNESTSPKDFLYFELQKLNNIEKLVLVEKHLISKELMDNRRLGAAIISKDEKISIMINEEDHLRIQAMFPGMQLDEALDLCNRTDDIISEKIEYAYDEKIGYLTSCPTNIGTGIRASVMLHLPAITMSGYLKGILEACGKIGVTVRGLYGENTEALGNMFQVSNQVTLGQTEEEVVYNIKNITKQITNQERALRDDLYKQNTFMFEDKVFRSLGILKNARVLTSEESHKLLSDVRLGIDMGIIKDIEIKTINELMAIIQPGSLQVLLPNSSGQLERDVGRAEIIRKKLNKLKE
ncbi:protein arginine kinase [Pseudobacteroides cellulosolvens]|nr:protein arginine kinase [Pseudobacteroides cellulosolvens]